MSLFHAAKQSKTMLENALDAADKALKAFDEYGKSEMDMTPDFVKAMPEWQQAKKNLINRLQNCETLTDGM